jgi:hypothetical protein
MVSCQVEYTLATVEQGRESHQIRTDQFGFGAISRFGATLSGPTLERPIQFNWKMSDLASCESDPPGTEDLGSRLTLRCLHFLYIRADREVDPTPGILPFKLMKRVREH